MKGAKYSTQPGEGRAGEPSGKLAWVERIWLRGRHQPWGNDSERSVDRPRPVARRWAHTYWMPCERPPATAARWKAAE